MVTGLAIAGGCLLAAAPHAAFWAWPLRPGCRPHGQLAPNQPVQPRHVAPFSLTLWTLPGLAAR